MLAGMLVVAAAGGVLTTHFLMSDYLAFLQETSSLSAASEWSPDYVTLAKALH